MSDLQFSDSVLVELDPDRLYEMVSDITRMGEWSPVCRACWWDDDAGLRVGAWFTGRNETEERGIWETRCQVVEAEPGRKFAWEVNGGLVRWGFMLAAENDSTRLTESWEFLPAGIAKFHERFGPRADTEIAQRTDAAKRGIPITLAEIKKAAETA